MCGEFPLAEQIRLVLTDVLRTELVGRALEVTREIFDGLEVDAGCSLGVITTLELGHPLMTPPYRFISLQHCS
jgi:hypothetical protein